MRLLGLDGFRDQDKNGISIIVDLRRLGDKLTDPQLIPSIRAALVATRSRRPVDNVSAKSHHPTPVGESVKQKRGGCCLMDGVKWFITMGVRPRSLLQPTPPTAPPQQHDNRHLSMPYFITTLWLLFPGQAGHRLGTCSS